MTPRGRAWLGGLSFRALFWQALLALACLALPFGLATLVGVPGVAGERVRLAPVGRWEPVRAWSGDSVVRRLVASALPGTDGSSMLYAVGAVGGLFVSDDGGHAWRRSTIPVADSPLGTVRIVDLAVHPQDANELYLAVASPVSHPRPMVYWSPDGARTWQVRGGLGPRRVQALAFDPTTDELYVVTAGAIVRALVGDPGDARLLRTEEALMEATVASIDPLAPVTNLLAIGLPGAPDGQTVGAAHGTLAVGTAHRGLWLFGTGESTVGPASVRLTPVGDDPFSLHVRHQASVRALVVDARDGLMIVGTDDGLFISPDHGESWLVSSGLGEEKVLSLWLDVGARPGASTLYAGLAGGGAWQSDDRGVTWRRLGEGLGGLSVLSLAVVEGRTDDAQARTLYAGTTRGLWRLALPRTSGQRGDAG